MQRSLKNDIMSAFTRWKTFASTRRSIEALQIEKAAAELNLNIVDNRNNDVKQVMDQFYRNCQNHMYIRRLYATLVNTKHGKLVEFMNKWRNLPDVKGQNLAN